MAQLRVRVKVFGGLRVFHGNACIMRFRTRMAQMLLAYLVVKRYKPIKRAELADRFFNPEDPNLDYDPMRALTKTLNLLRNVLEPEGVIRKSVLLADRESVALNPQTLGTDLDEFLSDISNASKSNSIQEKIRLLQNAFNLYQGELLAGIQEDWLLADRFICEHLYERITCDLAQLYIFESKPVLAEQTVLSSNALIPNSMKIGCLLREMQIRKERLNIIEEPEPVKIEPPEIETHHTDLPVLWGRFFGRQSELTRLFEALSVSGDGTRLITLLGGPGIGKTRLASETGHLLLQTYRNRVYFLAFDRHYERSNLEQITLSQLPIQPHQERAAIDQIIQFLNEAPTLIILDNLEHLIEPAASLIKTLLERTKTLKCIATSRHPLLLPDEQVIELPPLSLNSEESNIMPESFLLFQDRIQTRNPTLRWTERRLRQASEICDKMSGIPLALELAAARAATCVEWDKLIGTFSISNRPPLSQKKKYEDWNQRMRDAIDWSVQLLAPELQSFLHSLSVFQGSWSVDAAEKVCNEPRALEYLSQLRMYSLINFSETPCGVRYHMLVVIQEYLQSQIAKAEWEELQKRHFEFFAGVANPLSDYAQIEADHLNFERGLQCAVERNATNAASELISVCICFWNLNHRHDELIRMTTQYLKYLQCFRQESLVTSQQLAATRELLSALNNSGRKDEASSTALGLQEKLQEIESDNLIDEYVCEEFSYSSSSLGGYYFHMGDSLRAREWFAKSEKIAAAWNIESSLRLSSYSWLMFEMTHGFLRQAVHFCDNYKESKNKKLAELEHDAYFWMNSGTLYRLLGDYARSEQYFSQSLSRLKQLKIEEGVLQCLRDSSLLLLDQARYREAKSNLQRATCFLKPNQDAMRVSIETCLGEILLAEGELLASRARLQRGLSFWQNYPHARWQAYHRARIAHIELYSGDPSAALVHCNDGLRHLSNAPSLIIEARLLQIRGLCEGEEGENSLLESLRLSLESGHRLGMIEGLEALAYHYALYGNRSAALSAYEPAVCERDKIGAPRSVSAEQFYATAFEPLQLNDASTHDIEKTIQILLEAHYENIVASTFQHTSPKARCSKLPSNFYDAT